MLEMTNPWDICQMIPTWSVESAYEKHNVAVHKSQYEAIGFGVCSVLF